MITRLYNIFSGDDLLIAEKIQQRRLQILVNSRIYYKLGTSKVSDVTWDAWAKELVCLQREHPDIAERVVYADEFKTWDASTGAFLPLEDTWVINKVNQLLPEFYRPAVKKKVPAQKSRPKLF